GGTRMTRCHECSLISRTGTEETSPSRSYVLDADSAAAVVDALPPGRILEVISGGGGLTAGKREIVTVDLAQGSGALESAAPASFDCAFVNGVVEHASDPVQLLRRVRATLKPQGKLLDRKSAVKGKRVGVG